MKLVDKNSHAVLIEFQKKKIRIHSLFLETILRQEGIYIPPAWRALFAEKSRIFWDDSLFQEALKKIYIPLHLNKDRYIWLDSE